MPLRYWIILQLSRFETVIFIMLFILLLVGCLWSLKTPDRNTILMEEVVQNKLDTTNFSKELEAEKWIEDDINSIDSNLKLNRADSTDGGKEEDRTVDSGRSNEIFDQQFSKIKKSDKLESQPILVAEEKSIKRKKLPRGPSYSAEIPVVKETGFGNLTITLANAHEYGYAYVAIDDKLWQQGEYNTTPLKIRLPVGNHKVEVRRDGFVSSPAHTAIFIEKDVEKRVSFILSPKKN